MKSQIFFSIPLFLSAISARPVKQRREVPQEHSHEQFLVTVNTFLKQDNPDNIQDAVFGLLGNAAGSAGQGQITDTDCLQQATADQAFTNAKAANDVDGMVAALVYRALERNTGKVGLASVLCTSIKATNPEIAALSQHQDPASSGAAQTNKDITLKLAQQIASVGGDPQIALKAGTFAPGDLNDATAAGNTCDDANDKVGCIFTLNRLVEDATAAEIDAAVAGNAGSAAAGNQNKGNGKGAQSTSAAAAAAATDAAASACAAPVTVTVTATAAAAAAAASASTSSGSTASAGASNLDLGSCSDPTIVFGDGFDGRKDPSFQPNDKTTFSHGSALGIKVITDFICQQLEVKCKASEATLTACDAGAAAAAAATGQAAADAFNQALGF